MAGAGSTGRICPVGQLQPQGRVLPGQRRDGQGARDSTPPRVAPFIQIDRVASFIRMDRVASRRFIHSCMHHSNGNGARTALCRADRARDTPLRSQRSSRAAEPGSFSYQACDTPEPYTGVAGPRSSCWSSMLTPEATSVRTALRAASASASANFPCSSAKRSSFPAIIIGLLSDPMAISGSGTGHNRFRGNS